MIMNMRIHALLLAACLALAAAQAPRPLALPQAPKSAGNAFKAVPLAYSADDIEPAIDTLTMNLHHGTHYQAYINNLNNLTAERPDLRALGVTGLVQAVPTDKLPAASARGIRNNAGGAWNHALYFRTLATPGSAATKPSALSKDLSAAITKSFGSLETMKKEVTEAGTKVFGSGWSWLCATGDASKPLAVTASPNQDNPLMGGLGGLISVPNCTPILGLDVWEHAYYKKRGPKRADYIAAWWTAVNWSEVSKNYALAAAGKLAQIGQ